MPAQLPVSELTVSKVVWVAFHGITFYHKNKCSVTPVMSLKTFTVLNHILSEREFLSHHGKILEDFVPLYLP